MPQICRIGDSGSHGGTISTGSPNVFINGIAVARNGDIYNCAQHGPNALIASSNDVTANDIAVIKVGDFATCGATMISGSPNVNAF